MTPKDTWFAEDYNKTVPFVYSPENTSPILQLLDAKIGEKICDFGCGSGEITLELQNLVGDSGSVVGVDSSESMVIKARENGVKLVIVADVQDLPRGDVPVREQFDAVFSNAALHWCKSNPGGVLDSAKRVLRRGGRFVVEMGGFMNSIGIRSVLHSVLLKYGYDPVERDPWYFPSSKEYQSLLERHGFRVLQISITPRVTPLQGTLKDWIRLFCRENFFRGMDDSEANMLMDEVTKICAVDFKDSVGRWSVMYTRLRVVAVYE